MTVMNLYWCTTPDHDEDWFVVADSAADAARFHEDCEGYDPGDAEAELVVSIPDSLAPAGPEWPSMELLKSLGGEVLRDESPRVVRFDSLTYAEGMLDAHVAKLADDEIERRGGGRPNRTPSSESDA